MLSRKTRLLALLAFVTAALVPGAAVFVRPAHACTLVQIDSPAQLVPDAEVIVIGEVIRADADELALRPEAFLKGPASAEEIVFRELAGPADPPGGVGGINGCPRASLAPRDRVLVYIFEAESARFPLLNQVYVLRDGRALMEGAGPISEVEAVSSIRAITGQYAVPAASEAEGAGIDWGNTVLPLGLVLLVIFGIGLVLMRVWHRIDPS